MRPIMQEIYDEGVAEGISRAMTEGRVKVRTEITLEMLKYNYPINLIAKFSKFTIEEIKDIANKNGIEITE